nr:MAG TPA: hypothetical protein [Caudoviricetes sp.]
MLDYRHRHFFRKTKKIIDKSFTSITQPAPAGFFILDNVPQRYIMYLKETANRQDAHEVAAGGV